MKLGLLLSGAVKALDIQSQFRAYIDTAYPSCQAVIAKCERPFIGYDIKERVFSQKNYDRIEFYSNYSSRDIFVTI